MAADSALDVAFALTEVFNQLGVEYLVGGSLASSLHGEPRSTQDVDLVAALRPKHVNEFVDLLADEFYVDKERVTSAVGQRGSFNVIHLPTSFKADIFVLGDNAAARTEMSRKEEFTFQDGKSLWVATAEDIILQKLLWYRLGNEVSDRQWRDVLSVFKVNAGSLDDIYLERTAKKHDLESLLDRARKEAT